MNNPGSPVHYLETMAMTLVLSDPFNAFVDSDGPAIPAATDGPLAGCLLAVKDIFDVAGHRTGCGNPHKREESGQAANTAPAVQALLDAGAAFIGKTQTDELAFSLTGDNAHYPRPVNPAAPERVTGGSSSGSAAAVAAGLADIATGSDTGGSIRAPASYCGLVGLRITHGGISLEGTMPLAPSFDTFGWFARDIELYTTVAELLLPPSQFSPARLLRLPEQEAMLAGTAEQNAYADALQLVQETAGGAVEAGLETLDIEARYWCLRKLQAHEAWQNHGAWISAADRDLGPGVKERFAFGSTIDDETVAAETAKRAALSAELGDLIGDDGLVVMPTVPGAAPLAAASFDDIQDYRERAIRLLCLSGLTGFPQLTLPVASVECAPFGISLMGPKGSDRALLSIGRQIINSASRNGKDPWTR
ncbi:amidase [Nitratireductor sp. XY-223]|uniref:amidase n=1 Tax=Nitratireductor sp. XY-223 TaxID=2561926 RepID=UPI001FEDF641|nr:amidase [Nitratireductor sp. XY-223]